MTQVSQDFVDLANRLADASRPILRSYYRRKLDVDIKSDASPVTQADREAEAAIRKLINATFPEHGIFGEEYGVTGDSARQWIIDPIDGTANYLKGIPMWTTLIALAIDGVPRVGVASQPAIRLPTGIPPRNATM